MKIPFFDKNKEKKAQELRAHQTEVENQDAAAIQEINELKDPGQRIVALQGLKSQIESYLQDGKNTVTKKADKSEGRAGHVADAALYGGLGTSLFLTGPIGWTAIGVGLAGYMGAEVVGALRGRSIEKKYAKENAGHAENLYKLQDRIDTLTDQALENNVETIRQSPYYSRVRNISGLSEKFSLAVAKHIADQKAEIIMAEAAAKQAVEAAERAAAAKAEADAHAEEKRKLILQRQAPILNNKPKQ